MHWEREGSSCLLWCWWNWYGYSIRWRDWIVRAFTSLEGVVVEHKAIVSDAIHLYAASSADFADCVILESARGTEALPVHSFDRRFARNEGVSLLADREP
jgi:predicted nucleic-acid-binding protein